MLAVILTGALTVTALAACSITSETSSSNKETGAAVTQASTTETSAALSSAISEKDKDPGYDEATAEVITLNGGTASSDSSAVSINGSVVTIKGKGTFVITGTLDDGYVVVDAGDSDDIHIVLKGVNITSSDYAAL